MLLQIKSRLAAMGESGATAVVFAIAIIPILGISALAIDYGRATSTQKQLQQALDSAVLAAARAGDGNNGQITTLIRAYMHENYTNKFQSTSPTITSTFDAKTGISASATLDVPTSFGQVVGLSTISIKVDSVAAAGSGDTEIALVLDNTGSMNGAKIDGLKAAAKTLVDTLYASPGAATRLKMSLVPFTYYVNVGTENRSASWIDVPADTSSTTTQCYDTYPNAVYSNPRTVTGTCYNDGVASSCTYTDYDVNWGAPVNVCSPITSTSTWNGCVGSRNYPRDMNDAVTSADRVPGIMNAWCPSKLARLTYSPQPIKDQIDTMSAAGETYLSSGLLWGWRVLSPNAPFADGAAYSKDVRKVMVFMTDGANTKSPQYPDHEGNDATLANKLTAELCGNIKAAGITVYTVAYDVTDATINDLLTSCSSGPPYSYSAATTGDLQAAFASIGNQLVSVRLTK